MMASLKVFLLAAFAVTFLVTESDAIINGNPHHRRVNLEPSGKYVLEWIADFKTRTIHFNVTAQTTGYVGFGLSRRGKMTGADIVIGGVDKHGKSYFSDRHAISSQTPVVDHSQDWTLNSAWERNGRTFLSFSRPFDTCDTQHDMPITDHNLIALIWSYGESDLIQYHYENRGMMDMYLLDPEWTPQAILDGERDERKTGVGLWTITSHMRIPAQDTFYFCRWFKIPFTKRKHIIGFNTAFPTPRDRQHVHHLILHRCRAPPGMDPKEFFEGPSQARGSECYILDQPNQLPVPYCREVVHVWGVGGREIFFPDHAGIPISGDPEEQYYMFQAHYDNPESINQLNVTVSLEVFLSDKIRKYDVGSLQLGALQPAATTVLVPPRSPNWISMGHCAPGCTERIFPPEGVKLFAAFLHTHISGRGVRVLHLRNNKELPWISADDNYNFNFQQFRPLRNEVHANQRDLMLMRCNYDITLRNGSAVHGGFSTREEMCSVFMYYYTRTPGFALCRSEIRSRDYGDIIGVYNTTWDRSIRQMRILDPPQYHGMTVLNYANNVMDWTLEMRQRVQEAQIFAEHTTLCPRFHYDDPQQQIDEQARMRIVEQTGRLPGSDGRRYTSVDMEFEQLSSYPRNIPRYRPPPPCSRVSSPGLQQRHSSKNEV